MFISKKNRIEVYSYLFKEGVLVAKKDNFKPKHDEIDVPNLEVLNLMKSLKSRGFVRETFNWQYSWTETGSSCSPSPPPPPHRPPGAGQLQASPAIQTRAAQRRQSQTRIG